MSDPIIPWLCDVLQSYNPIIGREKDMLLACNRLRTSSQPNHWCFWTFFISVIFLCILFYILWHSFLLTCEVVWYTVLKSCSNDYLWKCTTVAIFIWTFFFFQPQSFHGGSIWSLFLDETMQPASVPEKWAFHDHRRYDLRSWNSF